jgi:hypothetical protein
VSSIVGNLQEELEAAKPELQEMKDELNSLATCNLTSAPLLQVH